MKRSLLTILVASVFTVLACTSESKVFIDDSLLPFFESFKVEGEQRGWQIDFAFVGVEGYIGKATGEDVVGQCNHSADAPDKVTIDAFFWRQASYSHKEFVIFHELGHCYLKRSHLDDADEFGNCISIMQSSANSCNSNYEDQRAQYLDELFDI